MFLLRGARAWKVILIFNNWQDAAQTSDMDKHRLAHIIFCLNLPSQRVNHGILSIEQACPLVFAGIYEEKSAKKSL